MKRFALLLVASLALAGCGTTGGIRPAPPISPAKVSEVISQVQSGAKQICSFVPTAQTVAHVLEALGVPYIGMVADISGQICDAVTTRPLADGPGNRKPRVKGVVIHGKFVR